MIAILEGAERTGKTTIAKMLEKDGFVYIKDAVRLYNGDVFQISNRETNNRIDTAVNYIKELAKANVNIVIDRLHISNAVFAKMYRERDDETYVKFYDSILANIPGVKLFLFERGIDDKYVMEHPVCEDRKELQDLKSLFRYHFEKSEIKDKVAFNFAKDNPEYILDCIEERYPIDDCEDTWEEEKVIASKVKTRDPEPENTRYDFYLASPFFNDEQNERLDRILKLLRDEGYEVFVPKENAVVKADDNKDFAKLVFNANCNYINQSDMVLAITDGKDVGTIWEAGYAYGIGVPVVYYAETLGDNPFNLMLAESGIGVFTSYDELKAAVKADNFMNTKEGMKYE